MKRQELKNLLHGVENSGDIIDAIMELNGADIESAKRSAGTEHEALTAENERLKTQLKAYEQGGEKYIDPAELTRLQNFEAETIAKGKRLHRNYLKKGAFVITRRGLTYNRA